MSKLSAKARMLNALEQAGRHGSFSVSAARKRFGVHNIAARIKELRDDGNCIYTKTRKYAGVTVKFYRLGAPTKDMVKTAIRNGHSLTV